ncbi:hypothetical protein QOT17_002926 [Balamuthia mandrillaris]
MMGSQHSTTGHHKMAGVEHLVGGLEKEGPKRLAKTEVQGLANVLRLARGHPLHHTSSSPHEETHQNAANNETKEGEEEEGEEEDQVNKSKTEDWRLLLPGKRKREVFQQQQQHKKTEGCSFVARLEESQGKKQKNSDEGEEGRRDEAGRREAGAEAPLAASSVYPLAAFCG